jgi:hypothetical protein
MKMNPVERFRAVMDFKPVDRLPRWEWATWWDKTIDNWKGQGLPARLSSVFEIAEYFDLDPFQQFWLGPLSKEAEERGVAGSIGTMDDYERALPLLYPDRTADIEAMQPWGRRQAGGDAVVWLTLEGFYWFPRTLMGIERHMYGLYDSPELIHRINRDLCDYGLRLLDRLFPVCVPTFITLAEDMSYNHGPMLSRGLFDEFLTPYYKRLIARLREKNVYVIVDTDGDVTEMVPWLKEAGIQGVLPLERQAGVDGTVIRAAHPDFRLIGHFDKMVMNKGESRVRQEFERLLPLMRTGGFIPSVDHQTPPHVTLEEYRLYRRLLDEYTEEAAR